MGRVLAWLFVGPCGVKPPRMNQSIFPGSETAWILTDTGLDAMRRGHTRVRLENAKPCRGHGCHIAVFFVQYLPGQGPNSDA